MSYDAEKAEQAANALLDAIIAETPRANSAALLRYAEAIAWITSPNQPHGSQLTVAK